MKKILVCNQKGGVGKSLIADELAFSFERSGIPTAFLDLDSQGGTIHKTDKNVDAEVCVIDTPGSLQPQLKDWLAASDGMDAPVIRIPQSEQFVQASAVKKSVIGFAKKSAAATVTMRELCDAVRAAAGFPSEDQVNIA